LGEATFNRKGKKEKENKEKEKGKGKGSRRNDAATNDEAPQEK
tara:strand:- start:245 stop:373 length:129 start_codon:yes stop_codon:yes gene_type:complete